MKILPINRYSKRPVFSGYVVEDRAPYGYPRTHLDAALRTGRRYQKTLESFHDDVKNKIYYADPLEKITDALREQVDYIFYDDEPPFPDIEKDVSKVYFSEPNYPTGYDISSYQEKVNNYREYFYRMEMADSKFVGDYTQKLWHNIDVNDSKEKIDYYNARIADSKYNQETATGCVSIMEEAKGKLSYKSQISRQIWSLGDNIKERKKDVVKADKELEHRNQFNTLLETKLGNLKKRQKTYDAQLKLLNSAEKITENGLTSTENIINYNRENLPYSGSFFTYTEFLARPEAEIGYRTANEHLKNDKINDKKELNFIQSKIEEIKNSIESYTTQIAENEVYIKKISDYKIELPKIIKSLEDNLKNKQDEYKKVQAELIPYFDKLKNYFFSRGLRQVKY